MRVNLRGSAYQDLVRGAHFYDRRQPGLGTRFFDTLWDEIQSLATTGGMHAKLYGAYYRYVSRTFPHAIVYKVENGSVIVCAVFDCRRNPERLHKRLR